MLLPDLSSTQPSDKGKPVSSKAATLSQNVVDRSASPSPTTVSVLPVEAYQKPGFLFAEANTSVLNLSDLGPPNALAWRHTRRKSKPTRELVTFTVATDIRAHAGKSDLVVLTDWSYQVTMDAEVVVILIGFRPPPLLGAIDIDGDSMKDAYPDGSLVLYDPLKHDVNGGANYIIQLDGYVMCKRVQSIAGGGYRIKSANRDAGYVDDVLIPELDEETEEIHLINQETRRAATLNVIGKVVWPDADAHSTYVARAANQIRKAFESQRK